MSRVQRLVAAIEVSRTYFLGSEEIHAVRGVNMAVYPGQFLALVGRSGSGKTTLLNIVGGLDHPTSGQMLFGEEWSRLLVDGAGRVTEYLTLDLKGVGPGAYDLRLSVDLPGGREPIEVTRRIERQE